jgi:1-acyl-sn-glycerol-3-phosphate acyltransferase
MPTTTSTESNTLANSSPINSSPLNAIFDLNGVPLFTYVMIGITTVVLACVTMLDDSNKSYAKDEGFLNSLNTPITSEILPSIGSSDTYQEEEEEKEQQEEQQEEKQQQEEQQEEKQQQEEQQEEQQEKKDGGKRSRKTKTNVRIYKHNKSKKVNQHT